MLYFYSGETYMIENSYKKFCGIWHSELKYHTEVFDEIIKNKKEQYGCEIIINAFNVLPNIEND